MTDSMIHEVDTTRWLLGEEITAGPGHPAQADAEGVPAPPGPAVRGLHAPRPGSCPRSSSSPTASTATTSAASSSARSGTASMVNPTVASTITAARWPSRSRPTGAQRFGAAYTAELQAWITGLAARRVRRPQRLGGLRRDQGRRGRRRGREDRRADDHRLHREARPLPLGPPEPTISSRAGGGRFAGAMAAIVASNARPGPDFRLRRRRPYAGARTRAEGACWAGPRHGRASSMARPPARRAGCGPRSRSRRRQPRHATRSAG